MAARRTPRPSLAQPPRSRKAGRPPTQPPAPPHVRRRQRKATAAVRKGTTLLQPAEEPRVLWGGSRSRFKKR
jgi:hypothetical protein